MIYPEYERCKAKYYAAQERFEAVLTEQERLFTKTLPKAITYDRDRVQTSPSDTVLINYVIAKDDKGIDNQLKKVKRIMLDRKKLLEVKEEELRKSPDVNDRVYVMRCLDGYGVNRIARILNYSKSHVYRIIEGFERKSRWEKMRK